MLLINMRKLLFFFTLACMLAPISCSRKPRRVVIGVGLSKSNHPAAKLAEMEINQAGGIKGVPLELIGLDWEEGEYEPAPVIELANRFTGDSCSCLRRKTQFI